jgi:hypothetical protein
MTQRKKNLSLVRMRRTLHGAKINCHCETSCHGRDDLCQKMQMSRNDGEVLG